MNWHDTEEGREIEKHLDVDMNNKIKDVNKRMTKPHLPWVVAFFVCVVTITVCCINI